jgi:HD-like signal output (HDOD) protein
MRAAKLVSLPEVYLRLKSILDDSDFAMAEVAVVISRDPATSLRLLRMVNSSLYGFKGKIETVSRAISLLGTQQVHDLVLATSVARAFKGMPPDIMDMRRFWRSNVDCAVTSRLLAGLCGDCDKERLFVAGLLHDIGHLFMYQEIPDLSQQAILAARETGVPLYKIERTIIGFDYAKVGSEVLQIWSLPESLVETTLFHVEPVNAKESPLETALVHLGSLMTQAVEGGIFNEGPLTVDPSVWSVTGLSIEDCTVLHDEIEIEAGAVMDLMFA